MKTRVEGFSVFTCQYYRSIIELVKVYLRPFYGFVVVLLVVCFLMPGSEFHKSNSGSYWVAVDPVRRVYWRGFSLASCECEKMFIWSNS
jgi:hypothetical protein